MKLKLLLIPALLVLISCSRDLSIDNTPEDIPYPEKVNYFDDHVPGWITVKFSQLDGELNTTATRSGAPETGVPQLDAVMERLGTTTFKKTFEARTDYARQLGMHLFYDFYVGEAEPLTRAMSDFAGLEFVELVEPIPNEYHVADITPAYAQYSWEPRFDPYPHAAPVNFNDPMLSRQWHYRNDGTVGSAVTGCDINLLPAWEVTQGHPSVVVAVIDTGIDFEHPDLAQNMWVNPNPGPYEHKHGRRWSNTMWPGYDIIPMDHGTHCAGTIAAVNNNGMGVSGIAGGDGSAGSGVRIMAVQCFLPQTADQFGSTVSTGAAQALEYAGDMNAVIASMSLSSSAGSTAYRTAIQYFNTKDRGPDSPMTGGIIIAAASNNGLNEMRYPAAYNDVVSVAWLSPDFRKHTSSNYNTTVNISAPGGNISNSFAPNSTGGVLSTAPMASPNYSSVTGPGYSYKNGTSMATPHVSGVAALIVSALAERGVRPSHTDVWNALMAGTRNIYLYNPEYHVGKLLGTGYSDARLALALALGEDVRLPAPVGHSLDQEPTSLKVNWLVSGDFQGEALTLYRLLWSTESLEGVDTENPPAEVRVQTVQVGSNMLNKAMSYYITGIDMGQQYHIALVGVSKDGIPTHPVFMLSEKPDPATPTITLSSSTVRDYLDFTVDTRAEHTIHIRLYGPGGNSILDRKADISIYAPLKIDLRRLGAGVYTLMYSVAGIDKKIDIIKI